MFDRVNLLQTTRPRYRSSDEDAAGGDPNMREEP